LVDRLVAVLTDPALARRLGDAGRAWVEADWRWDTQADRLTALLTP
jgi:phosphatidylinositol alpha-1,6-mannosyltransferase